MVAKLQMRQFRKSKKYNSKYLWHIYSTNFDGDELMLGVLPSTALRQYGDSDIFILNDEEAVLLEKEIVKYAWNRLLNYLSIRERSEAECVNYLYGLSLNEKFTQQLLSKGKEYNYLNDERFAELFVTSYLNRNKSRSETKTALYQKRIEPRIIEEALEKYYPADESSRVLAHHVEKGIRKYPDRNSRKDQQKCIAYLMRKGFSYSDFRDSLDKYYFVQTE
ncbi:MAG: RecX family transcriptional regulator [Candidatus Cloacimonadia bacterium]